MRIRTTLFIAGLACTVSLSPANAHEENEKKSLHFEHPLVSESPSPDTKLRFDYTYQNKPGEGGEPKADINTVRIEGEYAFNRSLSVEIDVPYTFRDPNGQSSTQNLDNAEIAVKYAN